MPTSAFCTLEEIVEDACFSMDDFLLRNKMKFLRIGKRVYNDDLKLSAVKIPKRQFFYINKTNNTIQMPCDFHHLSGVSWMDKSGQFHPLYRNEKLNDDIVDIKAKKDCACSCGGTLCNLIKSYESIVEEVEFDTPNGGTETFSCMTIKGVDGNGWYYETIQYPIAVYEDGVWVSNELKTEKRDLCKLEYDAETGCVLDCPENEEAVTSCACSHRTDDCGSNQLVAITSKMDTYMIECGTWFSRNYGFKNIFNISEEGDRLIFPSDIPIDKVLVRYYTVNDVKNIKVPLAARSTMITGILYENVRFKTDRDSLLLTRELGQRFANEKFALIGELNKYNAASKTQIMSPVAYIP